MLCGSAEDIFSVSRSCHIKRLEHGNIVYCMSSHAHDVLLTDVISSIETAMESQAQRACFSW